MLPFLNKRKLAQSIIEQRVKGGDEGRHVQEDELPLLECAKSILSAIEAKDASALASALSKLMEYEEQSEQSE